MLAPLYPRLVQAEPGHRPGRLQQEDEEDADGRRDAEGAQARHDLDRERRDTQPSQGSLSHRARADTEGENVCDARHGDGDTSVLHGEPHPLSQGQRGHTAVLVEVVPAGHDHEHVVYPDS